MPLLTLPIQISPFRKYHVRVQDPKVDLDQRGKLARR
jgi:hypothetical protein